MKRKPRTNRIIAKAGGVAKTAQILGLRSQAVTQWGDIPPRHVLTLARALGIAPHKIRPDLYTSSMTV